ERAEDVARSVTNPADAERAAVGGVAGDKKAPGEGPSQGKAWLVDGSPQEITAFLARLGDAARRAGLDPQNGEAHADSVLARLPVQRQPDQAHLELLQKDASEREQQAAGKEKEKAKSAPADGPSTGGSRSTPTPPAARGAPSRVRLVVVLRRESACWPGAAAPKGCRWAGGGLPWGPERGREPDGRIGIQERTRGGIRWPARSPR